MHLLRFLIIHNYICVSLNQFRWSFLRESRLFNNCEKKKLGISCFDLFGSSSVNPMLLQLFQTIVCSQCVFKSKGIHANVTSSVVVINT